MKKLWSLVLLLTLALGFAACEKDPKVDPDPVPPTPQGPTELPGSVTNLAYELNGYQEATLTWTNPEEEFELTGFVVKYRSANGDEAEESISADDYDTWPIEEYVIEGLEEQSYSFEVLTKNDYGTQKNGTSLDDVKVYTLTGITMPSFEIIEKSVGFVLSASNLSGATNVYYGLDWAVKSSDGTVVAEGKNLIDEELFANIDAKTSTLSELDLPIDAVLDENETYSAAYTLYAYPALGGTIAEGVYTYESILDMGEEPASVEGVAEGLTAKAEVEPMVIHFWGGDSPHARYEKVLMTLPLIYHNQTDADGNRLVKAVKYKLYSGASPEQIEVEKELAWDSDEWLDQTVDNAHVSALCDNYRDKWNGTLTYRLDCETYPAYVRGEAYDEFGRLIAMGQYYTYAYSVKAEHKDILDHQPVFALVDNADAATYTLTAKHISAARAYAKKLTWAIKDGETVLADGATAEVGVAQNPALTDGSWIIDATNFEAGKEYTIEYSIDYMPVLNSAEMGDTAPLDYDPATGIFTPALDPENPTGMTHDARVLREYVLDENGQIKYRVNAVGNSDDKAYMHVAAEGYTYRYLNHWNYSHCDPKVVTITSQDMLDAHASMKAPAVVAPELTGELAAYDMKLVADVDEGTKFVRADFNNGWQNYGDWAGLKSVNGIYQGVKVSWNHTGAYKISKVVINGVEVTADGENKWSVDDKFVGSYVVEGITTSPATIDVKVYSGEELLAEDSAEVEVYTLPETGSATFDVKYDAENGGWKLNSTGFSTKQYGTWKFSFNVYEKGSNTPVFENDVTKNSKDETITYKGWISRGYLNAGQDISVSNSDYDDGCTPEFTGGSSDVFSGLKYGTEYEIRYKMQVWPIIFDSENAGNTETVFYYKKILMNSDSDEAFGTRTLEGTYEFTTEAATAEISVIAAAQGYQGAKLTWNEVAGAAYYKVAYGSTKIDAKIETTEYVIEPETLTDANKYKFTVTAYGADDAAISSATTEDVEIFTMCNYTEPVINFNEVEGGYQVVASNLVQLNYAYAGGATVTLKKDGEVVYVLKNNTGDGTIAAWAGYKRWALNAMDNRKDWKWTVNGTEEEKEVKVHAIEDGNYTVEWEWDYVINKNGKWSNAESNGNFTVQEAKDETTKFVHFAGGTSDVLWVSSGVPYRVKKSGKIEATIGNAIPVAKMEVKADVAGLYQGAKLTWDAVEGAAAIQVAYTVGGEEQLVEVAGDATEQVIAAETLNDAHTYDFVVTALNADEVAIAKGEVSTEVFTMYNYTEPELILTLVALDHEVKVANLVEPNYAYVGGTLEFYKGGEKVYTLVNKTGDGTLNAWAGYKRWALSAMDNRKDWKWNDEAKECNKHAIEAGEYTIKYSIEYAVNKNGTWATNNGSFVPQENEEGATYVYFANGKSDVLYDGANVKRMVKTGEWTATVEEAVALIPTAVAAGYQNAKLTWNEITGAASYKVSCGTYESEAITGTEFTLPENTLTDANKYKFTVTAYDADNAVIVSGETAEVQIFTLTNRPEPVVTLADGVLTLANAEVNPSATKKDNLHIYGAALEAEIFFYKDGAAEPTYTAKGTYLDTYPSANLPLSYKETKLKNNIAGAYTSWKWNGAAEATATAPNFEAGTYTIKYNVGYHTFVNASYGADRLLFTAESDALQTMIYREGETSVTVDGVVEMTATASVAKTQYQAATVSWNAIPGATGYEVYVGETKVAEAAADATSVEVTNLTDDTFYEFTVKAVGTSVEGKTAKTGIFTLAKWVEPTFEFNGKRMVVSGLTNFDQPGGAGYSYGGMTAEGGKSTIEIYKDGQLLYTLTNSTPQGTLNTWSNSGCMVLTRVENRKDWAWTKADGSALMQGETDVPEGSLPAGTYTLKWTIGYTLFKNCNWSTGQSDAQIVTNKADATQLWFGPKDNSSRPNVWHNGSNVGVKTMTGETTLVIEGEEPEVVYTTVAEFFAAPKDDSANAPMYTLKGTITSVTNTQYGNFDLTDDTGTVYIYGLMSPDGKTNKYWATSGAKLGDDIVVKTIRTDFNGTPQGEDAWFVELVSPGTRAFYTVDKEVVNFPSAGGEEVVAVTKYNTTDAVTATSDNAKFSVSVSGDEVTITSAANDAESPVTGTVNITVGSLEVTAINVTLAAKPAEGQIEGGQDDFDTLKGNTSYASGETADGWVYTNAAVHTSGNIAAIPDDSRGLTINGKTTAKGTITSPVISTGCGTLSFNYAYGFSESKGIDFTVTIKQGGAAVYTKVVKNAAAVKNTAYSFSENINLAGDFQIEITNNSPTNSTSNKDRYTFWDFAWSGYEAAASTPSFDLAGNWTADYTNFSTTNAMYNTAHSGSGGAFTFVKLASEDGKSPKDGQKYYAQYKKYPGQDIYFDLDTNEIDGKPGCYALINMIDREAASDKLTNNKSYYDSVNDVIYFDFVTEASGSPGTGTNALGDYTVAGYLWTAKMTR